MKKLLMFLFILPGCIHIKAQNKIHIFNAPEKKDYLLSIDRKKLIQPKSSLLYSAAYRLDHYKYFNIMVPVKLANNSSHLLQYVSMSCSWMDIFKTNSKIIPIQNVSCDKNSIIIKTVSPHQSVTISVPIIFAKSDLKTNTYFKIGMNLQRPEQHTFDLPQNIAANNIWLNTVKSVCDAMYLVI